MANNSALLFPDTELNDLVARASAELASVRGSASFSLLSRVAEIYHRCGETLGRLIYERDRSSARVIACQKGCAHCCHVPSLARPADPQGWTRDIFRMCILDVVVLINRHAEIKAALGDGANRKIIGVRVAAATTRVLQPCPFLGSADECLIYAFRPVPCNIWFSADVALCRRNRDESYSVKDDHTDRSNDIRIQLNRPFADMLARYFPALPFGGYDYLMTFGMIAEADECGRLEELKRLFNGPSPERHFRHLLVPQ